MHTLEVDGNDWDLPDDADLDALRARIRDAAAGGDPWVSVEVLDADAVEFLVTPALRLVLVVDDETGQLVYDVLNPAASTLD